MKRWDVNAMLDEMTPQEFDGWLAYHSIEPFDDGWLQAGVVASVVQNSVMSALAAYGGKRLKESDMVEPGDFVPGAEPRRKRGMTPDEYRQLIESRMQ